MKILVLTTTFPRWKDDTTPAFVYELSKRLQENGWEIVVLAPHHEGAKKIEIMDGMKVYRFPYFWPTKYQRLVYEGGILPNLKRSNLTKIQVPLFILAELYYAFKIIRKEKINGVHTHWIVPSGLVGAVCKIVFKKPFIISSHGSDLVPLMSKFFKYFGKFALNSCDICTVNSTATKDAVLDIHCHIKELKIIPMGIDLKLFNQNLISDIKKDYKINSTMILTVGRISEEKGIEHMIKAVPFILKEIPEVKLVIIGDGPEKNRLEELVKNLNLTENIIFIGWILNNDLNKFYKSADIFVLPSLREGMGVVLLEAMACGTPVIGSDIGGIKDMIKDGENGFLAVPGNPEDIAQKIIRLLSNEDLRQKFSDNGLKKVQEKFSWDVVNEKFVKIYEDLK
jgi:N-acetyl-alpha-D-glucosaminyl L-malate synthase BshA